MKTTESAASKGAAISPKKCNNIKNKKRNILIVQSVSVVVIDVVIAFLVFLVANLVCSMVSEAVFDSYMTVLFIPLISFLTGFASFAFTKNLKLSLIANILLTLILHIIFNGFGWSMFLWELLYILNAGLGYLIALAARSYRV